MLYFVFWALVCLVLMAALPVVLTVALFTVLDLVAPESRGVAPAGSR